MSVINVNKNNFKEEVIERKKPVLLDFGQHGADRAGW